MAPFNKKPTQILLATFITFFLLLLNQVNSSNDLSFTFNKFEPNQKDIVFQGDASVSSTGVLRVTKVEDGVPTPYSIGRAQYVAPVRIWDATTGRIASFTTSFSFVVKAPVPDYTSDGLAFFLAPFDSHIPPDSSPKYLGLFNNPNYNSSNQIVAVEFDTYYGHYYDPWDPDYIHIGIDVNSIKSIKTEKWDFRNGELAKVVITYVSPTKTLTASLTYPLDETISSTVVSASVDLKAILPEWVSVGFSAGTGSASALETHDVISWYFSSTSLEANNYAAIEDNAHVALDTDI